RTLERRLAPAAAQGHTCPARRPPARRMANEEARQQSLTPLPSFEDLPRRGDGLDPDAVREAFEAYRRHAAQLQAQLRVLPAAGSSAHVEPTGHAVRMDSLHLIRAAAHFA